MIRISEAEQTGNDKFKFTIICDDTDEATHVATLLQVLLIYNDRKPRYGGGWRRIGALGQAFFIKDRSSRVWDTMRKGPRFEKFNPEDLVDLLNIVTFCLRSVHEDNYGGEFWPDE